MKKDIITAAGVGIFTAVFVYVALAYTGALLRMFVGEGALYYYLLSFLPFIIIGAYAYAMYRLLKISNVFSMALKREYIFWSLYLAMFVVLFDRFITTKYLIVPDALYAFLLPAVVAFSEELLCRVVLLRTFEKAFGFYPALILQAAVFTVFHNDYRIRSVFYYMIFGLGAGYLIRRCRNQLAYPVIAHYIGDIFLLIPSIGLL